RARARNLCVAPTVSLDRGLPRGATSVFKVSSSRPVAATGRTCFVTDPIEPYLQRTRIAYFSMEIALRPDMHTFSGGLGVLAGDTARSAADLELPMVFVSLLTRSGYVRQEIDRDGRQVAQPNPWRPPEHATPLDTMAALKIEGREVWVRPWLYR